MLECLFEIKTIIHIQSELEASIEFYKNVTDGGKMDLKVQEEWDLSSNNKYWYHNKELRHDDLANILYGFVGAELFSLEMLCFGAGMNQIKNHGFNYGGWWNWFDDPRDTEMIEYGYHLYEWRFR